MAERYTPGSGDHYFESYASVLGPMARGFVLDIGCGEGHLSARMANRSDVLTVIGTDRFEGPVQKHPKFIFLRVPTEELVAADTPLRFDTIISTEHIEHLPASLHRPLLAWVRDHLAEDGQFLGSMPDSEECAGPWHKKEYRLCQWEPLIREFFPEAQVWPVQSTVYVWRAHKGATSHKEQ